MWSKKVKVKKEYKKARALVVCADGVATSTIVLVSLREGLEERGVQGEFVQGRVLDVDRTVKSTHFDFVISTAGTCLDVDVDIPIISGIPFLTGVGKEQTFDQIMDIVNKNDLGGE